MGLSDSVFRSQNLRPVFIFFYMVACLLIYIHFYAIRESLEKLMKVPGRGAIVSRHFRPDEICPDWKPRLKTDVMRMLYWTSFYGGGQKLNRRIKCGKVVCELTSNKSLVGESHLLLFHGWKSDMLVSEKVEHGRKVYTPKSIPSVRFPDQYWMLFMLEAPIHFNNRMRPAYETLFNWTMTYRSDSDVFFPYGRFWPLEKPRKLTNSSLSVPATKTKLVAWIISNCFEGVPSKRFNLVKKLQEHIAVDVYGKCGSLKCKNQLGPSCKKEIAPKYKFYLSFENTLCQDYITEKVFHTYEAGMVPIVYGSANYDLFLPRGSFININSFPSVKALAHYLRYLDVHDEEYLKYFDWKRSMKLRHASYYFEGAFCNACRKLHSDYPSRVSKVIPNMTDWLLGNKEKGYRVCNEPMNWD